MIMETKKVLGIVGVVVGGIIVILLMIRFIYGGPEDTWVCDGRDWVKHGSPRDPKPDRECGQKKENESASTTTSIASPASVFCLEQDGSLAFKVDENGNQYAVCIFDDGRECEEWEFYKTKKCGGASIPQGGEMEKMPTF